MPLLAKLTNLKVYFYDRRDRSFIRAVEDVSFGIPEGSIIGIVGETGCGKTVTALTMMGLIDSDPGLIGGTFFFRPPDEDRPPLLRSIGKGIKDGGSCEEDGLLDLFYGIARYVQIERNPLTIIKDTEKWLRRNERVMLRIRGRNISMVFQNPRQSLNPFIPVGKQLVRTIQRFQNEKTGKEAREEAISLLESVRLHQPELVFNMYPNSLSVGMAQRVIISIALASRPKLLIADEPTTGLDTTNIHKVIDLLEALRAEMNLTLILISHNMGIVSTISDWIVVMYAGFVVESGKKSEVIEAGEGLRHPYTEALISATRAVSGFLSEGQLPVIRGVVPNNKLPVSGCPFLERCQQAVGPIRARCESACPGLIEVSPGHFVRCCRYNT